MSGDRKIPVSTEQLAALVAVLELGGVTPASEAIHVSQSTVTHHLKSVQQALGVTLFEPVGRGVRPSDAGLALTPSARVALAGIRDFVAVARSLAGVETGLIRIGASQTAVAHYLPSILAGLLRDHPRLQVQVDPGNTVQVCERVATAEVDLGLIEGRLTSPRLLELRLARDSVALMVGADHPLAGRDRLTRAHLARERYIAREPGSGTEQLAESMLGDLYHRVDRIQLGQMDAVRAAVLVGLGFAALPRVAVEHELRSGALVELSIRPRARWISAIRRRNRSGPATEALWRLLEHRAASGPGVAGAALAPGPERL